MSSFCQLDGCSVTRPFLTVKGVARETDSYMTYVCKSGFTRLGVTAGVLKGGSWTNDTCRHVSPLLLLLLEEDESELSEGERLLCFLLRCLSLGLRLLLREVEEEDKEEEVWRLCFSLWLTWSSQPENTHTQKRVAPVLIRRLYAFSHMLSQLSPKR